MLLTFLTSLSGEQSVRIGAHYTKLGDRAGGPGGETSWAEMLAMALGFGFGQHTDGLSDLGGVEVLRVGMAGFAQARGAFAAEGDVDRRHPGGG